MAVEEGKVVGHILFTKVTIGGHEELALAPLAVPPTFQRRGIGLKLMEQGHKAARAAGFDYVVVLGHEKYYPKAGYQPASRLGIKAPFDVPDENFMAIKLNENAPTIKGSVQYDEAFGITKPDDGSAENQGSGS